MLFAADAFALERHRFGLWPSMSRSSGSGLCSDCCFTPGLGLFFLLALPAAFPRTRSPAEAMNDTSSRSVARCCCPCSQRDHQNNHCCLCKQCAGAHKMRWGPRASSRGPGSSRLPWEPCAPFFLSLLPPFNLCHAFSGQPIPLHICMHNTCMHTYKEACTSR